MPSRVVHHRQFASRSAIVAVALTALAACGGGGTGATKSSAAEPTTSGNANSTSETTASDAATANAVAPLVAKGAPTRFSAGGSGAGDLTAQISGPTCTVDGLFGTCSAGGSGTFVVTMENDPVDFSIWNIVVRCGLAPASPLASLKGKQQPMSASLSFPTFGDVVGISSLSDKGSEAVLAYSPPGSKCPQLFGLGPISTTNIFVNGPAEGSYQFVRPDSAPACVRNDASADFAVTEGAC